MDPLREGQVSEDVLRGRDPLERARVAMEAGEKVEQRRAEEARAAEHERFVQRGEVRAMEARIELANKGFLQSEVDAVNAEREQLRRGRIGELESELARLRAGGTGPEVARSIAWPDGMITDLASWRREAEAGPDEIEVELSNAEAERSAWSSPAMMRMRRWALEGEAARSRGMAPPPRTPPPPVSWDPEVPLAAEVRREFGDRYGSPEQGDF